MMIMTKYPYAVFVIGIFVRAAQNGLFKSQQQSPDLCIHHNFTLDNVSEMFCAAVCVRQKGCRTFVYTPSSRRCMGCQYVSMRNNFYADSYDVPVETPAGSVTYTPEVSGYMFTGCYADCMLVLNLSIPCQERTLAIESLIDSQMTVDMCFKRCSKVGAKYLGTEVGSYCFCGLVYDKHGVTDRCDHVCGGNLSQTCGGHYALSLFEILLLI